MSEVEFSVAFQTDKAPTDYGRLGERAEQLGFDAVSVYHDLFYQPSLYPLFLIAQATSRVRLGPAALNPFTLHPIEIAGQIAALDALSGGRAYLGLVRGSWLDSLGIPTDGGYTAVRETVEVVQRLLRGDRSGFTGKRFSLAPGHGLAYRPLRADVPLLIGTWSPRLAALAGEVAREVKVGGTTNPDMVRLMRDRIGNDDVGVVVGAVTVVDEDGAAARRRAREHVAPYVAIVADYDTTLDLPAGLVVDLRARLAAGDGDGAGRLVPDELLDRFAFAGTPRHVAGQVEQLLAAGARRIEFGTPHGLRTELGLELLAREVVPAFATGARA